MTKIAKPKKGDTVSMAFHYAGLVSWETATISKVAKGGEVLWLEDSDYIHERKSDGTYVNVDTTIGYAKRVLYIDGGKLAKEHAND